MLEPLLFTRTDTFSAGLKAPRGILREVPGGALREAAQRAVRGALRPGTLEALDEMIGAVILSWISSVLDRALRGSIDQMMG